MSILAPLTGNLRTSNPAIVEGRNLKRDDQPRILDVYFRLVSVLEIVSGVQ